MTRILSFGALAKEYGDTPALDEVASFLSRVQILDLLGPTVREDS